MITSKFKSLLQFNALKFAQNLFVIIPLLIMAIIYIFLAGKSIEQIFNEPILIVQFITLLTYPFCYLLLKTIRNNIHSEASSQLLPLWILAACNLMSFNVICSSLLICGIYQEYSKEMFNRNLLTINKKNRSTIISLIPLGLLYIFIIFIKFRLGMF